MGWEARKQRFEVQYSEGLELQRKGMWNHAIVCFSNALRFMPEDVNALLARSRCYILVGKPDKALADAEAIIVQEHAEGYNRKRYGLHRGLLQKADTLYARGDFEEALLWYHRGYSQKPDIQGFKDGIKKAEAAIYNSISNPATRGRDARSSRAASAAASELGSPPSAAAPTAGFLASPCAGAGRSPCPSPLGAPSVASPAAQPSPSVAGVSPAASPQGKGGRVSARLPGPGVPLTPSASGRGDGEASEGKEKDDGVIFGLADAVADHLETAALEKKEKSQVAEERVQERKLDANRLCSLVAALPEFRRDLVFLRDLIQSDLFDTDPVSQSIIHQLHQAGEVGLNNNNHHANAAIYSLHASKQLRKKAVPAVPPPPPPVPAAKDANLPKFGQARRSAVRAFKKRKKNLALRHQQHEDEYGDKNDEAFAFAFAVEDERPQHPKRVSSHSPREDAPSGAGMLADPGGAGSPAAFVRRGGSSHPDSPPRTASCIGSESPGASPRGVVVATSPSRIAPSATGSVDGRTSTGGSSPPCPPLSLPVSPDCRRGRGGSPGHSPVAAKNLGNTGRYRHYTSSTIRKELANEKVLHELASVMEFLRERQRFWSQNTTNSPNLQAQLEHRVGQFETEHARARVEKKGFSQGTESSRHREAALQDHKEFLLEEARLLGYAPRSPQGGHSPTPPPFLSPEENPLHPFRPSFSFGDAERPSASRPRPTAGPRPNESVVTVDIDAARREQHGPAASRRTAAMRVRRSTIGGAQFEALGGGVFRVKRKDSLKTGEGKSMQKGSRLRAHVKRAQDEASRQSREAPRASSRNSQVVLGNAAKLPLPTETKRAITNADRAVIEYPVAEDNPGAADDAGTSGEEAGSPSAVQPPGLHRKGEWYARDMPPERRQDGTPYPCLSATPSGPRRSATPHGTRTGGARSATPGLGAVRNAAGRSPIMSTTPGLTESMPGSATPGLGLASATPGLEQRYPAPSASARAPPRHDWEQQPRGAAGAKVPVPPRPHTSLDTRGGRHGSPSGNSPKMGPVPVRPGTSIGHRVQRRAVNGGAAAPAAKRSPETWTAEPADPAGWAPFQEPDSDAATSVSDASHDWVPRALRGAHVHQAAAGPPLHGYTANSHAAQFVRNPIRAMATTDVPPRRSTNGTSWRKLLNDDETASSTLDSYADGEDGDETAPETKATKFVVAALAAIHSCIQYADLFSAISLAQNLLDQVDELVIKNPHVLTADLCDLLGTCHLYTQNFGEAKRFFQKQLVLCRKTGNRDGYEKAVAHLCQTFKAGGQDALACTQQLDLTKATDRPHRPSKVRQSSAGLVWDPTAGEDGDVLSSATGTGPPPSHAATSHRTSGALPPHVEPLVYADGERSPPRAASPFSDATSPSTGYLSRSGNGPRSHVYRDMDSVVSKRTRGSTSTAYAVRPRRGSAAVRGRAASEASSEASGTPRRRSISPTTSSFRRARTPLGTRRRVSITEPEPQHGRASAASHHSRPPSRQY